jgi:L-amino acid N-acyltransferase YncA
MLAGDAEAVLAIYQQGLDGDQASFETVAPSWRSFDEARRAEHRYVAVDPGGVVVGWVAVSSVSAREVYQGVVEHSVYVDDTARGKGVGTLLLATLVVSTEAAGIWTVQSGVVPENEASLRLHQRMGFRVIGRRERVGRHRGVWRDVLLLERRSPSIV